MLEPMAACRASATARAGVEGAGDGDGAVVGVAVGATVGAGDGGFVADGEGWKVADAVRGGYGRRCRRGRSGRRGRGRSVASGGVGAAVAVGVGLATGLGRVAGTGAAARFCAAGAPFTMKSAALSFVSLDIPAGAAGPALDRAPGRRRGRGRPLDERVGRVAPADGVDRLAADRPDHHGPAGRGEAARVHGVGRRSEDARRVRDQQVPARLERASSSPRWPSGSRCRRCSSRTRPRAPRGRPPLTRRSSAPRTRPTPRLRRSPPRRSAGRSTAATPRRPAPSPPSATARGGEAIAVALRTRMRTSAAAAAIRARAIEDLRAGDTGGG